MCAFRIDCNRCLKYQIIKIKACSHLSVAELSKEKITINILQFTKLQRSNAAQNFDMLH